VLKVKVRAKVKEENKITMMANQKLHKMLISLGLMNIEIKLLKIIMV